MCIKRLMLFTPSHLFLLIVNIFLAWLYLKPGSSWLPRAYPTTGCHESAIDLPPLVPQEWTLSELRQYDGVTSKRILIAVDWRVFDVTKAQRHYGPGTPTMADHKL